MILLSILTTTDTWQLYSWTRRKHSTELVMTNLFTQPSNFKQLYRLHHERRIWIKRKPAERRPAAHSDWRQSTAIRRWSNEHSQTGTNQTLWVPYQSAIQRRPIHHAIWWIVPLDQIVYVDEALQVAYISFYTEIHWWWLLVISDFGERFGLKLQRRYSNRHH